MVCLAPRIRKIPESSSNTSAASASSQHLVRLMPAAKMVARKKKSWSPSQVWRCRALRRSWKLLGTSPTRDGPWATHATFSAHWTCFHKGEHFGDDQITIDHRSCLTCGRWPLIPGGVPNSSEETITCYKDRIGQVDEMHWEPTSRTSGAGLLDSPLFAGLKLEP